MLSLTGTPLLVLTILLAVASIAGLVVLVVLATGTARVQGARRLRYVVPTVVLALLSPVLTVFASGLVLNNHYGFYTSWADLAGAGPGPVSISTSGLIARGQGALEFSTVRTHVGGLDDRVLVWTPPGYDPHRSKPYPVLMFLPGQPSSPQGTFRLFGFGSLASRLVLDHQVPAFVAVFPTLMLAPPRDTECTNLPGSIQAETWLNNVVPAYLTSHYRVQAPGQDWSMVGWSTGGFCAAKLLTAHPGRYGAAVALGAYFTPLQDHSTGSLFDGLKARYDQNSPLWLYLNHGLADSRLLIVSGRQDRESWPETRKMLLATAGDPQVSQLIFPTGGHNYRDYERFLGQSLIWATRGWTA
jgi:S-formylglutathione hydrolase FrmB